MPVNDTPTENPAHDLNDQMKVRHAKRERLLAEGKQAYPVGVARTHSLEEVREQWGHLETGEEISTAHGPTLDGARNGCRCWGVDLNHG